MSDQEKIKKFLEDLNKSEEGKKLLQEANPKKAVPIEEDIPEVPIKEEKQTPKELVVEPNKEDKKKKKNLKWWNKAFNKDKFKKQNKAAVIYLRNNGNADLMEIETRGGSFNIEGNQYNEDRDCVYTITKDRIPLLIVREWDLIPIGTKKWDDETMREKFSELSQHVLKGIRNAESVKVGGIGLESKITTKQLILWGLAGLVGVILLTGYLGG